MAHFLLCFYQNINLLDSLFLRWVVWSQNSRVKNSTKKRLPTGVGVFLRPAVEAVACGWSNCWSDAMPGNQGLRSTLRLELSECLIHIIFQLSSSGSCCSGSGCAKDRSPCFPHPLHAGLHFFSSVLCEMRIDRDKVGYVDRIVGVIVSPFPCLSFLPCNKDQCGLDGHHSKHGC